MVLLRFLETLGNRAPARRREDRRERAFRDADEASLDDPAQPPSMAARQRAPDPPVEPGWTRMGRESAFPARGERRAAARGAGGGQGAGRAGAARRGRWTARGGRWAARGGHGGAGGGRQTAAGGARGRGAARRGGARGGGGHGRRHTPRDRQGAGRSCGKARCPLPPLPANMIQTVMDKKRRFLLFFGLKGPSACALRPMFEQNSWSKARAVSLFPNGNRETVRFCPELADASAEPRLTRIHAR